MEAFRGRSLSLFDFLFCDKSVQKDKPCPFFQRKKKGGKEYTRTLYNIQHFCQAKLNKVEKQKTGICFFCERAKNTIGDEWMDRWMIMHIPPGP